MKRTRLVPIRRSALLCVLLLLLASAQPFARAASNSPPAQDPRAAKIADEVWQAMGGDAGWNQARFIKFDFLVEVPGKPSRGYHHCWDRFTGRYRVEGTNKDGQSLLILFNVNDKTGKAWVDGKLADPEKTKQLLEYGYGRFINDTYWFLMPFKMKDPGVHLSAEPDRADESGKKWQVVHLNFNQGIGLTSGDQYWAYIDPATHLMGRWDYELEGKEHEKGSWLWTDWQKVGSLMVCPDKKEVGGDTMIRTPISVISETVDESMFQEPK